MLPGLINCSMLFDPYNKIVHLCAKGMELEGQDQVVAKVLFMQAWNDSSNDLEKCITAHYLARQQVLTRVNYIGIRQHLNLL